MVKEIGSFEAKTRLAEILRQTERGHSFIIRRRGKIVARLIPASDTNEVDLDQILADFRKIREAAGPGPNVRQLIEEGRRC
jgi:prevent-host-death family protein